MDNKSTAIALYQQGHNINEISRQLAIPASTARYYVTIAGVHTPKPRRKFTTNEAHLIKVLRRQGWTQRRVARELGRHPNNIRPYWHSK